MAVGAVPLVGDVVPVAVGDVPVAGHIVSEARDVVLTDGSTVLL